MAEQGHRRVDLVEIDLRERPVDELDVVPVPVASLDVLAEDDLDVLGLTVAEVETGTVGDLTGLARGPSSRKPSPPGSLSRRLHPSVR